MHHLLLSVAAVVIGAAPAPCDPSETFEAHGRFEFWGGGDHGMGDYRAARATAMKKNVAEGKVDEARHEKHAFWNLEDYATEKKYWENVTTKDCDTDALNGTMPTQWSWIKHATFSGTHIIRNRTLNLFSWRPQPTMLLEIGCFEGAETVPVFFHFKEADHEMRVDYHNFTTTVNPTMFDLKPNCH